MILYKYIGEKIITNTISKKEHFILFIYNNYTENSMLKAYNFILNNLFLKPHKKDKVLDLYNKIKNVYNKLSFIARLHRWRKYKKHNNNTDLLMNPLSDYRESYKINIIQNKTIYTFRLSDLLNIWNNALKKSNCLSSTPCYPKNPYNNLFFKKQDMVNIFIKIKETGYNIPILILYFWKCELNLKKFKFETFPILKDFTIYNYVDESDIETLYFEVKSMLFNLRSGIGRKTITLDETDENKKYIVTTLKPYLRNYLMASETSNEYKSNFYYKKVIKDLINFYNLNPRFGRKIVRANRNLINDTNIIINSNNNIQVSEIDLTADPNEIDLTGETDDTADTDSDNNTDNENNTDNDNDNDDNDNDNDNDDNTDNDDNGDYNDQLFMI